MIDGLYKEHLDRIWEGAARPLARVMTANQVTALGVVLVAASAAAYLWHGSSLVFGLTLAVSFSADSLDGAVARLRGESSRLGAYFDALADRYQELAMMLAIATVTGAWLAATLGLAGGLLTSYAKARTAVETRIDNNAWPDLFERQERIVFLCGLLIVDGLAGAVLGVGVMVAGLWLFAGLTHLTALQRIRRARAILLAAKDDAGPPAPA